MAKALPRKRAVPPKRKTSAATLKAKAKSSKKPATSEARSAKSAAKVAGIEKSSWSLKAILQGVRQSIAALRVQIKPFDERASRIESAVSELNGYFDTRVDQAIIEIAERIENQRLVRRSGNPTLEPSSGSLASVIAKFEDSDRKRTCVSGSFGSNSR